ncbi:MAG: hypothetical protein PHR68_04580 [Candidatus Gracilibacteria bacterium]|nr:hypothetical protein [Candidatus Gracilibacteria bacterium]
MEKFIPGFITGFCVAAIIAMTQDMTYFSLESVKELTDKNVKIIPTKGSVDINCTVRFTDGKIKAFVVDK